jgi:hypothetical protein
MERDLGCLNAARVVLRRAINRLLSPTA